MFDYNHITNHINHTAFKTKSCTDPTRRPSGVIEQSPIITIYRVMSDIPATFIESPARNKSLWKLLCLGTCCIKGNYNCNGNDRQNTHKKQMIPFPNYCSHFCLPSYL